ncbi:MAG: alpha/beta hydrolase, partial [Rhodospirillaceae bacterium]|nr:alpha/beta hydrolase [Rhodospirillaceae bacterium]
MQSPSELHRRHQPVGGRRPEPRRAVLTTFSKSDGGNIIMAMKPQLIDLLEAMKALGLKPMHELSPVDARIQMEAGVKARDFPTVVVGEVEDRTVPGPAGEIPVRTYRPANASGATGALVYFHGGGHVIGSPDSHDSVARAMCRDAGVFVLSVDYRMGPEAKFPAAVDDCYAAT